MTRSQTYIVEFNKELENHMILSKELYNRANYINRHRFFKNKGIFNFYKLNHLLKNTEQYKTLPAQTAQQILKTLEKDWKSFFKLLKTKDLQGKPKPPRYCKKYKTVVYPGQNITIKNNRIKIPKTNFILILKENIKIKDIKLSNYYGKIKININYEKDIIITDLEKNNCIGIDLGLNNLCTITQNNYAPSWIVNGRTVKSINQYFNKNLAKIKSINGNKSSKRTQKLSFKRTNKVNDYLHKTSRLIIDYCLENNIGTIIIGNNKGWKQNINIGKRNNQNFVNIPFHKLIQMITYKAEEFEIDVIIVEESYTSKVDHLVNEFLGKNETYLGKRIKRGLFKSSSGKLVNADVNGSIGILRKAKVVSEEFLNSLGNRGEVLSPYKVNIY